MYSLWIAVTQAPENMFCGSTHQSHGKQSSVRAPLCDSGLANTYVKRRIVNVRRYEAPSLLMPVPKTSRASRGGEDGDVTIQLGFGSTP